MLNVAPLSISRLLFNAFIFIYIFFKRIPPTQCCHTALFSIKWQRRSWAISLFFFSRLFHPLCCAHTHTPSLPASSILTPPSVQDTAESWRLEPNPDALSHSHMRHLSGLPPPPCCLLSFSCTVPQWPE